MRAAAIHRALVAASGATIAAATAPVTGIGQDTASQRWSLAFADWRAAEAHARASDRAPAFGAVAWNAEDRAWQVLIDMPAPNGLALLWKLECLLEVSGDDGESTGWSGAVVAAVMSDARRMLGGAT